MYMSLVFILPCFSIAIGQTFTKLDLDWDIELQFDRDNYRNKIDSNTIMLNSRFRGDTSMFMIFDYNDITEGNSWLTKCFNSLDSCILNSHISQIILESEFGQFVPLSDNINSPTYIGYMGKRHHGIKNLYNLDVFPISGSGGREFKHYLSIPKNSLKICQDNQKVRLHYIYRTKKEYLNLSDKNYIITSNWVSINEIY